MKLITFAAKSNRMSNIRLIKGDFSSQLKLEHAAVVAGFPSPADDYKHDRLDFNRDYIRHPEASFYGDVSGDSMKDAGIFDGDRVIIATSTGPKGRPTATGAVLELASVEQAVVEIEFSKAPAVELDLAGLDFYDAVTRLEELDK